MLLANTMNGPKDSTALDKLQALQTSLSMSFPQMRKAHFCSAAQIIDIKPLQKTNQAATHVFTLLCKQKFGQQVTSCIDVPFDLKILN